MSSLSKYAYFRMDTAMSVERLRKIMAAMSDLGTANYRQISEATGISLRAVPRYVYHLCATKRLELVAEHDLPRGLPSVYGMAECPDDIAPSVQRENKTKHSDMTHRMLDANEWQRGEHAHRSGLLGAFYPLAQG